MTSRREQPPPADPMREMRLRSRALDRLLDDRGRVVRWPKRRRDRLIVLDYIAAQLELTDPVPERALNAALDALHTFHDAALLRRYLVDEGYLDRRADGSAYWVRPEHL